MRNERENKPELSVNPTQTAIVKARNGNKSQREKRRGNEASRKRKERKREHNSL
jgi:hypothetical protein